MQPYSDRVTANMKHTGSEAACTASNMRTGPFIAGDGHTLVIPADRFNAHACAQWRKWGFRYHGDFADRWYKTWTRDIRRPLPGYRAPHRSEVWLASARRAFREFFPGVMEEDQ